MEFKIDPPYVRLPRPIVHFSSVLSMSFALADFTQRCLRTVAIGIQLLSSFSELMGCSVRVMDYALIPCACFYKGVGTMSLWISRVNTEQKGPHFNISITINISHKTAFEKNPTNKSSLNGVSFIVRLQNARKINLPCDMLFKFLYFSRFSELYMCKRAVLNCHLLRIETASEAMPPSFKWWKMRHCHPNFWQEFHNHTWRQKYGDYLYVCQYSE